MFKILIEGSTLDFGPIINALSESVNVTTIGVVVAAVVGIAAVPMVFMWGSRKVAKGAQKALNGKIGF